MVQKSQAELFPSLLDDRLREGRGLPMPAIDSHQLSPHATLLENLGALQEAHNERALQAVQDRRVREAAMFYRPPAGVRKTSAGLERPRDALLAGGQRWGPTPLDRRLA